MIDTLSRHFDGAAGKLLSSVEADPVASNQHEFNGVGRLAELLGEPPDGGVVYRTVFVWIDDDLAAQRAEATTTWYDARAAHPTRSEFRLYYPANPVLDLASEGDYMVLAKPRDVGLGELLVILCPGGSSVEAQVQAMFGLEQSCRLDVEALTEGQGLGYASRVLLESLGIETVEQRSDLEQLLVHEFGLSFPSTSIFSDFARRWTSDSDPEVDGLRDPDAAVLAWMDSEELLYRTLERRIVRELVDDSGMEVDALLGIAMQTFQRRRSRAGHAFENHLAHVFDLHGVDYAEQARTEGKKKPDFLFPSREAYVDAGFPVWGLGMLGVKTTCKDRWRQVLTEADRVEHKHLCTLEAPISPAQLREMRSRRVHLVLPSSLHHEFGPGDQTHLLGISDLIAERLVAQEEWRRFSSGTRSRRQ